MSDDSDFHLSDTDFDEKKHEKLVENVLSINKSRHLKKPSRSEPTHQISEFNLVKSITGKKGSIEVDNLAKVLKARKKHAKIGEKAESTKKKTRTLLRPLEKPQADRIRRTVNYEKNRFLFDRWEAFVTANRAEAHQTFPLDSVESVKVNLKEAPKFPTTWTYKSHLQKELESLEPQVEEYHIEDDEYPLTLEELKEKRKEAAKLRAHQSFKEAKARRQNKIKSKKYHRILRKERIKQKLKEFEELQKTNPDEALKKLEEIERARALERFSLRHKSTGQWAKSKQIRAKYDKESRQVLAQQLSISRDLTLKQKHGSDSEDEGIASEETSDPEKFNADNPWAGGVKPDKDVVDFVGDYKKFWSEKNKQALEANSNEQTNGDVASDEEVEGNLDLSNKAEQREEELAKKKETVDTPSKKGKQQQKERKKIENESVKKRKLSSTGKQDTPAKKTKSNLNTSSGNWDIEALFDSAEQKLAAKPSKKVKKTPKQKKPKKPKALKPKPDLTIPKQSKKQIIDEPLNNDEETSEISALKAIITNTEEKSLNIDPAKFIQTKITNLDNAAPDLVEEEDEETKQRNLIIEAFEDTDIIEDFSKEKQEEVEKDKPQDIDLNLPGWGSWAGTGINPKKQRKRRRFIVKMPEVLPRRDDNQGSLIINEKAAKVVKPHLVSEVPFPFKTVKDYEASIRAPIGRTFVPELAHRRYIKPAVQTKMGTIIEPANTSVLMGKPKT